MREATEQREQHRIHGQGADLGQTTRLASPGSLSGRGRLLRGVPELGSAQPRHGDAPLTVLVSRDGGNTWSKNKSSPPTLAGTAKVGSGRLDARLVRQRGQRVRVADPSLSGLRAASRSQVHGRWCVKAKTLLTIDGFQYSSLTPFGSVRHGRVHGRADGPGCDAERRHRERHAHRRRHGDEPDRATRGLMRAPA